MGKPKYDVPTATFPYKITKRLNSLSEPHKYIIPTDEGMPVWSSFGVRMSALRGQVTDRVHDVAWPYLRRILLTKRMYKSRFSVERLQNIDRVVEAANATIYSKLANCSIDLKRDSKEVKKKRGWSESEWKKHMDYIGQIAGPKPVCEPTPVHRGPRKNIAELLPKMTELAVLPDSKIYRRMSQEAWYKNPMKVSPAAMKYVISERIKKLSAHKVYPPPD